MDRIIKDIFLRGGNIKYIRQHPRVKDVIERHMAYYIHVKAERR